MEKKETGLESLLIENVNFEDWCFSLSEKILQEKFISAENLSQIIKFKILSNEEYFYSCLCSELEIKIDKAKTDATRAFKRNSKKEYVEIGFLISSLNKRLKKYNIERTKAFQR